MSNIIRKTALFLIPVILMGLCSCGLVVINYDKLGNASDLPSGTDTLTQAETKQNEPEVTINVIENDYTDKIKHNLSLVPDEDYNSNVFKITSPDTSSVDGDGGMEFLSETAAARNQQISDKHNISIVSSKVDFTEYYQELNTAVKSGMYYSDLIMVPQEMVSSFAAGNLILNMRSMPGMDFDAEFLNESSVSAAAGGFNSYAVAGPASIYPYSLPAVFFNKDLCTAAGYDPYSLAASGEWVWDKFFEIGISASSNEYHFSWGTTELGEAVYETAFVSCGSSIIQSGIMQVPSLAFDSDTSAPAVDIIKRLYADENTIKVNSSSLAYFNEGNGFFQIEKLSAITSLKDSKIGWGILPMPKADASSSYVTLAGTDSLMFACPSTVSTPEKTATILLSLNAASEGVIKDAYINYIQYNFLRDNGSANMLDYIIDSAVYDFSYTFGNMYAGIADGTYNMIRRAASPDESMQNLINRYKGTLDRTLASAFGLTN